MPFSAPQIRKLRTNVRPKYIKEREVEGKVLPYVEAWHVIAEANRIFGHDGWDRETVSTQCIWQKPVDGRFGAAYVARVRITVRADGITIIREGFGAGESFAATPGQAHERAVKTAETDATKRALSTFGSCFGLALYQNKTTASRDSVKPDETENSSPAESGSMEHSQNAPVFMVEALPQSVAAGLVAETAAEDPVAPNREHVEMVTRQVELTTADSEVPRVAAIGSATSNALTNPSHRVSPPNRQIVHSPLSASTITVRAPVDKSELSLGEPKRVRNVEHLRFVASEPCTICGRQPSQAHHLRFTQPARPRKEGQR